MPSRLHHRLVAVAGALLLAGAPALLSSSADASASSRASARDPEGSLRIAYDFVGTAEVKRSHFDVPLGPSTLNALVLQQTETAPATLSGGLPIPPQTVSFTGLGGLLDVTGTVVFTQVGKARGQLSEEPPLAITASARYVVQIKNATVDGKPAKLGPGCQTVTPIAVTVQTPAGQQFDLTNGGPLIGTYTLPPFYNCGKSTDLVNILLPGPDNSLVLNLSNGRIVFDATHPA